MEIVTIIPTRGVIFSRTIESLKKNGINSFLPIEGLPIPDSHNEGVRQALKEYSSYVLIMEDDMVMPEGALEQMIKKDTAIVCLDYPMDNGYSTICRKGGEILWCGLGCILIKRKVLETIGDPWFTTDYSYRINSEDPLELEKISNPSKYGGCDINFCMKARELGYRIESVEGMDALHLRMRGLDKIQINSGSYEIYALDAISKRQDYT